MGDTSDKGLERSAGIMVNYLYRWTTKLAAALQTDRLATIEVIDSSAIGNQLCWYEVLGFDASMLCSIWCILLLQAREDWGKQSSLSQQGHNCCVSSYGATPRATTRYRLAKQWKCNLITLSSTWWKSLFVVTVVSSLSSWCSRRQVIQFLHTKQCKRHSLPFSTVDWVLNSIVTGVAQMSRECLDYFFQLVLCNSRVGCIVFESDGTIHCHIHLCMSMQDSRIGCLVWTSDPRMVCPLNGDLQR